MNTELKIKDFQECKQRNSSYLYSFESLKGNTYFRINLETLIFSTKSFEFSLNLKDSLIVCVLPNNELFFYGNKGSGSSIAFMLTSSNEVKLLPSGKTGSDGEIVYHNGYVFAFGGGYQTRYMYARKFDLLHKKGINISPLPVGLASLSCIEFENMILIAGRLWDRMLVYDPIIDSYSIIEIEANAIYTKFLFKSETRAYLLDRSGLLYENENHNVFLWSSLGLIHNFKLNES